MICAAAGIAAAASAAARNRVGAFIFDGPQEELGRRALFAEDQGLYVVSTILDEEFTARARASDVPVRLMPLMMWRWKRRNASVTGSAASTAAAISGPHPVL